MKSLLYYIGYLTLAMPLLAVVLGVIYRKQLNQRMKILWLYFVGSSIASIFAFFMARQGISNLPIAHAFTLFEFVILAYFFTHTHRRFGRRGWGLLCLGYLAVYVPNLFYWDTYQGFPSITQGLTGLVFTVFILRFFLLYFTEGRPADHPDYGSQLWIFVGLAIRFIPALFIMITFNRLVQSGDYQTAMEVYGIRNLFTILGELLLGLSFYFYARQRAVLQSSIG